MKIKKLTLKNIRSYENQEIEFPDGALLLSGDVGSGKTTILLAIEYALFGLQPGQKGSALLRNNSDFGEVSLEFEVAGEKVVIERKIRRGSKSVSSDSASLTIGEKRIESSLTEIKTSILSLLGYPSEFLKRNNILYKYTIYTTQEQMKEIILDDPESRLNVLRHIFGIDKYRRINDNLLILISKFKEESKILQIEIRDLDSEKENLIKTLDNITEIKKKIIEKEGSLAQDKRKRKELELASEELEQRIKQKEQFESEVEKTKIMIASKHEARSSLNRETKEITSLIAETKEEFDKKKLDAVIEKIFLSKQNLDKLNANYLQVLSKIEALEHMRSENLGKRERVFSIRMCPTCLQDVSETHKHNIKNAVEINISEIKKSLDLLEVQKSSIRSSLEKEKQNLSSLEDQKGDLALLQSKTDYLKKSRQKLEEMKKTQEFIEGDIALLTKHNEALHSEILNFSKFDNLSRLKKEELRQAFLVERNSEIALAELKKELELTVRESQKSEERIKEKEQKKSSYMKFTELNDWLENNFANLISTTERNVMLKLRKEFSKLFSKWFSILAGESFEIQLDENFTPLITQGEIEMDYSFLSGGERTAVALAYRLALNQTINSLISTIKTKDLIILDEPTEGFSSTQIDKMREIFAELKVAQLIIVSHEQAIESFVENLIKIKKENNLSSIERVENHKT